MPGHLRNRAEHRARRLPRATPARACGPRRTVYQTERAAARLRLVQPAGRPTGGRRRAAQRPWHRGCARALRQASIRRAGPASGLGGVGRRPCDRERTTGRRRGPLVTEIPEHLLSARSLARQALGLPVAGGGAVAPAAARRRGGAGRGRGGGGAPPRPPPAARRRSAPAARCAPPAPAPTPHYVQAHSGARRCRCGRCRSVASALLGLLYAGTLEPPSRHAS